MDFYCSPCGRYEPCDKCGGSGAQSPGYWTSLAISWWWRTPWIPEEYSSSTIREYAAMCPGGPFKGRSGIHPIAGTRAR